MTQLPTKVKASVIKKWAYGNDSNLPSGLQELATITEHADLLFKYASDPTCKQRVYILICLYTVVGESVAKHLQLDIDQINILLEKVNSTHGTVIINWANRSRMIIRDLRKYDFVEWCAGGFAKKDIAMAL